MERIGIFTNNEASRPRAGRPSTNGDIMAHPVIDADECICCGVCVDVCPTDTLELGDESAVVANEENCIACGQCLDNCPTGAITEIVED